MQRLRLSDPSLLDEFVAFLARSGFAVEVEDGDTVSVRLLLRPGPGRTEADLRTLLAVWVELALRIWQEVWPDADALALAATDGPRAAAR